MPETSDGYEWSTEAGKLCLDFANTMDWHCSDHPVERLTDYSQLVAWARGRRLLTEDESGRLLEKAVAQPERAASILLRARQQRDAIYRLFAAAPRGRRIEEADVRILNSGLSQAMAEARIEGHGGRFTWGWREGDDLDRMLWPVLWSAADLLASDERARVGQCADDRGCGWLFFDASRNHSRRWCSMEGCGNRAKAKRHYARGRAQAPTA